MSLFLHIILDLGVDELPPVQAQHLLRNASK